MWDCTKESDGKRCMDRDDYFAEIYGNYYQKIYNFIYYKVYDVELAEDLANDVFVAVYKNLHTYDESKSFVLTWLYAISWNRLKNFYKSRRIIEYSIDYMLEMNMDPVIVNADLLEQREWNLVLQQLLWDLPERNRNVILMKYYGNMTSGEIGKSLNMTSGNVRIVLKRTLDTLKCRLKAELSC